MRQGRIRAAAAATAVVVMAGGLTGCEGGTKAQKLAAQACRAAQRWLADVDQRPPSPPVVIGENPLIDLATGQAPSELPGSLDPHIRADGEQATALAARAAKDDRKWTLLAQELTTFVQQVDDGSGTATPAQAHSLDARCATTRS